MQLHSDWRRILKRAWSVRWMALAALLSCAEVALPFFEDVLPVPPGVFGLLTGLAVAGAFVSRIIAQEGFHDGEV